MCMGKVVLVYAVLSSLFLFSHSLSELSTELTADYYADKCPVFEDVLSTSITWALRMDPSLAPALLRLHFHDCFVRGCDGSILLDSPDKSSEKYSDANYGLRGFELVQAVKEMLEFLCPRTVSCADILALAAREAVSKRVTGLTWNVLLGRKDGNVSSIDEAPAHLPSPFFNYQLLLDNFADHGLDSTDLATLTGAHFFGHVHCSTVAPRAYVTKDQTDWRSYHPHYQSHVKATCKSGNVTRNSPADYSIQMRDDLKDGEGQLCPDDAAQFYRNVYARKVAFLSDVSLLEDVDSLALLKQYKNNTQLFVQQFAKSMEKMGRIDVKTKGEVRLRCDRPN